MKTYFGGHTVKGGYFFNLRDWKLEAVEGETGVLPGDARFVRVPMVVLLGLAPMMGLAFVVALPFIGLAVMGEKAILKFRAAARPVPAAPLEAEATDRQ